MKNSIVQIAVLISVSVLTLTACSTNTQKENTTVGAVTGAVGGALIGSAFGAGTGKAVAVGLGAVAGAFLGGYIGSNMDSADHSAMSQAMNNKTGKTTSWKNPNTGARYTITPTSGSMQYHGNATCRNFRSSSIVDGKKQTVTGTACQQSNGTWKTV